MYFIKYFILMSFVLFNFSAFSDPLTSAIEQGKIQQIKKIIRTNPSLVNETSSKYNTPYLHLLLDLKKLPVNQALPYLETIEFFLDYSADINLKNKDGESLLFLGLKNKDQQLIDFLFNQQVAIMREDNRKINLRLKNNKEQNVLFFVDRQNVESISSQISIYNYDLFGEQDRNGNTVLEQALIDGKKDLADFFMEKYFGSEMRNKSEELPYFMEQFIKYDYISGVQYILKNTEFSLMTSYKNPIEIALEYGNKDIADWLLKTGLLVEMYENPKKSVHLMKEFIKHDYFPGLEYLLENGLDPNEINEKGENLSHLIAQSHLSDSMKIKKLLHFYKHYKLDLHSKDYHSNSCFDYMNVLTGLKLRFYTKDLLRTAERMKMFKLKTQPLGRIFSRGK